MKFTRKILILAFLLLMSVPVFASATEIQKTEAKVYPLVAAKHEPKLPPRLPEHKQEHKHDVKPAPRPSAPHPAPKPATKPAPKPTPKPVPKPAPKPTPRPAPAPKPVPKPAPAPHIEKRPGVPSTPGRRLDLDPRANHRLSGWLARGGALSVIMKNRQGVNIKTLNGRFVKKGNYYRMRNVPSGTQFIVPNGWKIACVSGHVEGLGSSGHHTHDGLVIYSGGQRVLLKNGASDLRIYP